ncbi:uncharacterized protein LOC134691543 [Mytilus trossulus]|uniref:uncharacterized protein LOC134691543 n=1 Tax=Mytilus trossulus TaxID=6551 RepID=UPI0030058EA5
MPNCDLLWRISFSVAEKQLVHSFNFTQFLCYGLLKLTLKRIVNTNDDVKDLMCSYFLKTALFWVSEEVDIDTFKLPNLCICFSLCLNKLISWVNTCYCPNYFIPEHNMFLGKINQYNNYSLLSVLNSIKYSGISGLMQNLFHSYPCKKKCYPPYSETSVQSIIIQLAVQLLPPPNTNYNISTSYHRHLQNGIQKDAVSGWLLYASFYYVTGQFNVTLKLTEYVLSKFFPEMVQLGGIYYSDADIDNYRHNVHYSMSLNARMKTIVVDKVLYIPHSSLIPKELAMEVKDSVFLIPPFIMSNCLRFLCYHHIGDTFNRQLALRHLHFDDHMSTIVLSNTFTLLGVCFEISGDKDAAFHYYDVALQCDSYICSSAEKRKSRLLNI